MLKVSQFPRIDKVELHQTVGTFSQFLTLLSLHQDAAELNGVESIEVKNKKTTLYGRYLKMHVGKDQSGLEIGVFRQYGRGWLSYRFNGAISPTDVDAQVPYLDGVYSLLSTMMFGRVTRFELAVDHVGRHTSQYLSHFVGSRRSQILSNDSKSGFSQYSGRPSSRTQLSIYDRAQMLRDKKKPCPWKDLLRVELRFMNRPESLFALLGELFCFNPFNRVLVIPAEKLMVKKTAIKDWQPFITACRIYGIAQALQMFGHHKKAFLEYLRADASENLRPRVELFRKQLEVLFPYAGAWDAIDADVAASKAVVV